MAVIELTPLPLLITANAAAGKRAANLVAEILGGITGGLVFLLGVADLAGAPVLAPAPSANLKLALDISVMATGLLAAVVSARPVRGRLARVLPIDPDSPVHALALALTVILFGLDAAVISFTDVLGSVSDQPALSIADLLGGQLPFLVLALVGVGLFTRRSLPASVSRLGIVVPRWWHVALALAAAGVFFAFSQGMDALSHALTPAVAGRVDSTTQHVFGQLSGPLGIAAVAVIPGICEETLFRGALQPRLGLVVTALVFTSVHTEYGLSIDTLAVFTIALGLGLVRKYTSTTGSASCHVGYNLLAGVGVSSAPALGLGLAVEAALLAATAYGIWRRRRS